MVERFDYFVPSWAVDEGPDVVRRIRTASMLACLMGTMFGFVLIARLLAREWTSAAIDVGLVTACFGAPFFVRWTGRFYLVAHVALAAVVGLLVYLGVTNPNPGLNAATVALAEIPLFAIVIVGVRAGYLWSVVCAVSVLAIGLSDFAILTAPTAAERDSFNEYWAAVVMCLTLISAGVFYERNKEQSVERIRDLEASRREAELAALRAEADARLREAERFASMGRLAAAVAHEINNPLSYVRSNLGLVREGWPEGELVERALLDDTLEGVERIRAIVADLRALTRPDEEGKPTAADVRRAIDTAVSMAAAQTRPRGGVEVTCEGRPHAAAEESRLVQVLLNLVVNAAQAARGIASHDHRIVVRAVVQQGEVTIEVEDNGPGIPPELLAKIREPLFTTKAVGEGTGLGLAICESILRAFDGRLELESEPGCTVARVCLPEAPPPSRERPAPPPVSIPAAPASLRILICDDDRMVSRALARQLRGHDVHIVDGGREGLDLLAEDADFDVVFCDVMMPQVSGLDVYQALTESHPELVPRLVFMSGGAFTDHAGLFIDGLGDIPFMEKPIDNRELADLLARRARARDEDGRCGTK